ncbi:Uncharacterized protein TCAP_04619 [Tolypocladium capitatum]|uniref:Uncharacterized protein n=1 Tax=Tolypocladium capitatum TaxID=45235 RepID=A0A2K3QD30_9HYPO|nr:Uncharacterized protein TCAP_04619 [Tolypocladium capitatum]
MRRRGDLAHSRRIRQGTQRDILWISPENLDSDHLSAFTRALSNVLSTDLAEATYAQIIDGLPTRDSYAEFRPFPPGEGEHPAYNHLSICDGVLDVVRDIRSRLDPLTLKFDPHVRLAALHGDAFIAYTSLQVLQAFQNEPAASPKFLLRMVELLAVSLHEIAAYLFELHQALHDGEFDRWWASWRQRYNNTEKADRVRVVTYPPVPFHHNHYRAFDQYPRGRADMVGYWAEAKILGGVALFNRGPSDVECNELLVHGSLCQGPTTIYPLTDAQWHAFMGFLASDAAAAAEMPIATARNETEPPEIHAILCHEVPTYLPGPVRGSRFACQPDLALGALDTFRQPTIPSWKTTSGSCTHPCGASAAHRKMLRRRDGMAAEARLDGRMQRRRIHPPCELLPDGAIGGLLTSSRARSAGSSRHVRPPSTDGLRVDGLRVDNPALQAARQISGSRANQPDVAPSTEYQARTPRGSPASRPMGASALHPFIGQKQRMGAEARGGIGPAGCRAAATMPASLPWAISILPCAVSGRRSAAQRCDLFSPRCEPAHAAIMALQSGIVVETNV